MLPRFLELLLALLWLCLGGGCYWMSTTPSGAQAVASLFLGAGETFSAHQQRTVAAFALQLGVLGFIASRSSSAQVRTINALGNVVTIGHFAFEMRRASMQAWEPLMIVALIALLVLQLGGLRLLGSSSSSSAGGSAGAAGGDGLVGGKDEVSKKDE